MTVGAPAPQASAPAGVPADHTPGRAPADTPDGARADRRARQAITLAVVAAVVGQRLVVPAGGEIALSVVLPALYGAMGLLWVQRRLRSDRPRTELFLLAAGACLAASVAAVALGREPILTSLLYLVIVYVLWTVTVRDPSGDLYTHAVDVFLRLMAVVSVAALLQVAVQLVGGPYLDPIDQLPEAVVAQGYMTTYPVVWGSPILKANGMLMLEPSFLSQFTALAIIVTLAAGRSRRRLPLYAGALLASVSGTGLVLLGFGLAIAMLRGRLRDPAWILAMAVAAVAVALSPLGQILLERTGEFGQPGSSAHLRFIAPYEEVLRGVSQEPTAALSGFGAGTTERLLTSGRTGGPPVVYPIVGKLVFEYGVVAGALFAMFIVVAILRGARDAVIPSACLLMLFVLSGALLQPHTVAVVWLLTSAFAHPWRAAAASGPGGDEAVTATPDPTAVAAGTGS